MKTNAIRRDRTLTWYGSAHRHADRDMLVSYARFFEQNSIPADHVSNGSTKVLNKTINRPSKYRMFFSALLDKPIDISASEEEDGSH
jgi:hypothetical protein